MYCKHCGKEIADDSKFCQHCGGKQEDSFASPTNNEVRSEEPKKQENVIKIPTIKTNLSDNQKKWIGIYVAWALLNFIFIFIKGTYGGSNRYFFPFQADLSFLSEISKKSSSSTLSSQVVTRSSGLATGISVTVI